MDMAAQAGRGCRFSVPEARTPVLGVILRVVAVFLVIVDRSRSGAQFRYRGDHAGRSLRGPGIAGRTAGRAHAFISPIAKSAIAGSVGIGFRSTSRK